MMAVPRTGPASVLLLLVLCSCSQEQPPDLSVAVASNFEAAAHALADRFQQDTGQRVALSPGSTGKLYAQIQNGAPFDVFLAADQERPRRLAGAGLTRGAPFSYAEGRLALIGDPGRSAEDLLSQLSSTDSGKIAIANPRTAPYGLAAKETLEHLGIWEQVEDRLVFGENIAQTYQFVRTGGAVLGLVARSQVVQHGDAHWLVPQDHHRPIRQDAVALIRARNPAAVREFLAFLGTPIATDLLRSFGYGSDPGTLGPPPSAREGSDWPAIWLTFRLALTTTITLLLFGTPLAWWLARTRRRIAIVIDALVALPLVLPPTVLGFYVLVLLNPQGFIGGIVDSLGGPQLVFSFAGLLVGSVLYSLPFVVQPLQNSFRSIDPLLLDAAATLGASSLRRFFRVALPMAWPGLVTAATLGFAHTVGEFGVVLMIGGNIPGETRVLSIAIYDHVEALDYPRAHWLAAGMLVFSLVVLILVHALSRRLQGRQR